MGNGNKEHSCACIRNTTIVLIKGDVFKQAFLDLGLGVSESLYANVDTFCKASVSTILVFTIVVTFRKCSHLNV